MDLAVPGRVGAGEPLAQSRGERWLDGLEGALKGGRSAKSRRSEGPGNAAAARDRSALESSQWYSRDVSTHFFSIVNGARED